MEPMLPMPSQPEARPSSPQQGEFSVPANQELTAAVPERSGEMRPATQPVVSVPASMPQPAPVAPQTPSAPAVSTADSATPLVADDVDVIEKEWVDKAKKIVSSTKEDPHAQEQQVSRLQADYLMKRYNKQIKLAE